MVLRAFYEFWIDRGEGPLINPVPQERKGGRRPNAHRNPLEPFRPQGKLRYNPPVPKRRPRVISDQRWEDLFAALRSDRDRAIVTIVTIVISNGARAAELLGICLADVDWGDQLVRVRRKGTDAEQWLPASAEAFVWLRLYLDQVGDLGPSDPIWWTLRRRRRPGGTLGRQPLNYEALRAVFRRLNEAVGTNYTLLRPAAHLRGTHAAGQEPLGPRRAGDPRPRAPVDHAALSEQGSGLHQTGEKPQVACSVAPRSGPPRRPREAALICRFDHLSPLGA